MFQRNNDLLLTGAQIKEIRQKYGLSQQEFGSRLGVTHAHISKIESGKENPSETLLRLIRYEFSANQVVGIPTADITKPKIQQYLEFLNNTLIREDMSDGCLYNSEFLLAAYVTILKETEGSGMYRELLLEALGSIMDEVALFLERNTSDASDANTKALLSSKLQRAKLEISDCCDSLYNLLEERIK